MKIQSQIKFKAKKWKRNSATLKFIW